MRITVLALALASLALALALAWESESDPKGVKECTGAIVVFDHCLNQCKEAIARLVSYVIEALRWFEILAGYVTVQFLNLEPFSHTGEPPNKVFPGYHIVVSDFFEEWF